MVNLYRILIIYDNMKRMKVLGMFASFVACVLMTSCGKDVEVVTDDLKYCESVLVWNDGLLIANFGGEVLNPLNGDGRGYIKYYKNGDVEDFIVADGMLNAPKGMAVVGEKLWVADVNKVVVYDVEDRAEKPHVLKFPEGEMFVNHLVQVGNSVLVSVTNTGNIYTVDVDSCSLPMDSTLKMYVNVVGANGMLYDNSVLYVASYAADGVVTDSNQIYRIDSLANPVPVAITEKAGNYDGLAKVGDVLYFTEWDEKSWGKIDLTTGAMSVTVLDVPIDGPAEIDVWEDRLCVPDLVNSRVYLFDVSD